MCAPIMALPNALVYSGQLAAGSDAVANAALELPNPAALARAPAWARPLLDPSCKVAFLDTDLQSGLPGSSSGGSGLPGSSAGLPGGSSGGSGLAPGGEVQLREGTMNPGEAAVVAALVRALLEAGVPAGEIGVVSPYRAQVGVCYGICVCLLSSSIAPPSPRADGDPLAVLPAVTDACVSAAAPCCDNE